MTRTISRDLAFVLGGLGTLLLLLGCTHDLRARHGGESAAQAHASHANNPAMSADALPMRDVDRPSAKLGSLEVVHTSEVEPLPQ